MWSAGAKNPAIVWSTMCAIGAAATSRRNTRSCGLRLSQVFTKWSPRARETELAPRVLASTRRIVVIWICSVWLGARTSRDLGVTAGKAGTVFGFRARPNSVQRSRSRPIGTVATGVTSCCYSSSLASYNTDRSVLFLPHNTGRSV